jgi:hypothetical protein
MTTSTMARASAYEWARLRTVRATWWIAGLSVVITGLATWGYSAVISSMMSTGLSVDGLEAAVLVLGKPSFAPFAAGILGVFAVGNDYRYGTMRATLLVTPRRTVALAAKSAVIAGFAAVLAVLNLAVSWLVGTLTLGPGLGLSVPVFGLVQLCIAQIALTVGWALLGSVVTVLLRSQLFALAALLVVPFAIEPAIRTAGLLSGQTWLERIVGYLPFAAGSAMTDISHGATSTVLAAGAARVAPLVGGTVFFATIGALGLWALLRFREQDIG